MIRRIGYLLLVLTIVLIAAADATAAQFARPDGTLSSSGWTASGAPTLHEATDDAPTPDDGDYMIVSNNTDGTAELGLSNVTDPLLSTGHIVRFRMTSSGGGGPEKCNFELLQGAALIAGLNNQTSRGSYTTFILNLSAAETDSITDYSDLRVIISTTSVGNGEEMRISWVEFEVPDAAAATEPTVSTPSVSAIDKTSATLGATIDSDGDDTITARGTIWDTVDPPVAFQLAEGGTIVGAFSHNRTGMTPASLIYYRGYATNGVGTGYSTVDSFYTEPNQVLGVGFQNVTDTAMRITWTSDGTTETIVVVKAGSAVDLGLVTDGIEHPADASFGNLATELGTGNYVVFRAAGNQIDVTNLTATTEYFVAIYAYAGSSTLINYQQDGPITASQFTTSAGTAPTLSAPYVADINDVNATLGATIDTGLGITSRGTVWDESTTPRLNLLAEGGTALGFFSHTRDLPAAKQIYFAGYATNAFGTGYSVDGSFYTEADTQPSNIGFTNITDTTMRVTWDAGTGDGSIVIMKLGSAVNADPQDGSEHTFDLNFGNPTTELSGTGSYVVYRGSATQADITGLTESTTYYIAIFEYTGTGSGISGINYLLPSPPTGSQSTGAAPVIATLTTPTATAIDKTNATIGATISNNGGGVITERGTLWNTTGAPIDENQLAEGGTATEAFSHNRTGMPVGDLIYYRGYATNSAGTGYSPDASFYTEPNQAANIGFANINETDMRITWDAGTGESAVGTIVVVRAGSPVSVGPTDGIEHTANTIFGTGAAHLGSNNYVVYRGAGTQVDVTGLIAATVYHVAVYAYSGSSGLINYEQTSPDTQSQMTGGGVAAPSLSLPTVSLIEATTATLGATLDNDGGATIVARGTVWGTSASPTGNILAEGATALDAFSHSRSLPAGALIYYRGYADNSAYIGYSPQDSFYTEPTEAPFLTFRDDTATSLNIRWAKGTGSALVQSIVVVREGSAVDFVPSDGATYTANPDFGSGTPLGLSSDNYVVYNDRYAEVYVTGLAVSTTYHVAIYSYVASGASTNYQQDTPAIGSQLLAAPVGHNASHNADCYDCHTMTTNSSLVPVGEEQTATCVGGCHYPGGEATNTTDVNNHLVNGGSTIVDCGSCHEVHNDSSVTGTNFNWIRENTDKYVAGALTPAVYNADPNEFAFTSGPFNAICQTCHTSTSHHTNTGVDPDHELIPPNPEGKVCNDCHTHDGSFLPDLGDKSCLDASCHGGTNLARRDISVDFLEASHHVGVIDGNVPDEVCGVCHDEAGTPTSHRNGVIDLLNADTGNPISLSFGALTRNASSDVLEPNVLAVQNEFCLKCHDSDGATATAVNLSFPLDPFGYGNSPADMFGRFDTANNSHHAVRGVGSNPECNGTTMMPPWNQESDHDLISCFDCHVTNGHGDPNQSMTHSSIDFDTMAAATAKGDLPAGMGATVETFCSRCHNPAVYVDATVVASKLEYHGADQNQHRAAGGNELGCMGCHAGIVNLGDAPKGGGAFYPNGAARGVIHGANFDWSTTTSFATGQTEYFMLGGFIGGWQINGADGECSGGDCNHAGTSRAGKSYTLIVD